MKNSLLIIALMAFLTGCYQHNITMGEGAHLPNTVVDKIEKRHWYALWGNLDVSEVDIDAFVKENPDCLIEIETSVLDSLLAIFIGPFTFGSRTVVFNVPVSKDSDRGRAILEEQRKKALRQAMDKAAREKISEGY